MYALDQRHPANSSGKGAGQVERSEIAPYSVGQNLNLIPYRAVPCIRAQAGPLQTWPSSSRRPSPKVILRDEVELMSIGGQRRALRGRGLRSWD